MSEIVIEKGIPIPPPNERTRYGKNIALLKSMEVGDSFLLSNCISSPHQKYNTVAKRLGMDIAVLKTPNKNEYRVWRTK